MTDGEKLFNEIHARWMSASSVIQNFRTTFVDIAPSAAKNLKAIHGDLFQRLLYDPQWAGELIDTSENPKPFDVDRMAELSAEGVLK
jgi:hypothetical protein